MIRTHTREPPVGIEIKGQGNERVRLRERKKNKQTNEYKYSIYVYILACDNGQWQIERERWRGGECNWRTNTVSAAGPAIKTHTRGRVPSARTANARVSCVVWVRVKIIRGGGGGGDTGTRRAADSASAARVCRRARVKRPTARNTGQLPRRWRVARRRPFDAAHRRRTTATHLFLLLLFLRVVVCYDVTCTGCHRQRRVADLDSSGSTAFKRWRITPRPTVATRGFREQRRLDVFTRAHYTHTIRAALEHFSSVEPFRRWAKKNLRNPENQEYLRSFFGLFHYICHIIKIHYHFIRLCGSNDIV